MLSKTWLEFPCVGCARAQVPSPVTLSKAPTALRLLEEDLSWGELLAVVFNAHLIIIRTAQCASAQWLLKKGIPKRNRGQSSHCYASLPSLPEGSDSPLGRGWLWPFPIWLADMTFCVMTLPMGHPPAVCPVKAFWYYNIIISSSDHDGVEVCHIFFLISLYFLMVFFHVT